MASRFNGKGSPGFPHNIDDCGDVRSVGWENAARRNYLCCLRYEVEGGAIFAQVRRSVVW